MWCRRCLTLLILTALGNAKATSFSSNFVYRPRPEVKKPAASCDVTFGNCKKNEDCLNIGFGMVCIRGTCNCRQGSALIGGQCTTEKKIGSGCRVAAECFSRNGYCNEVTGKCSCIPGFYDYQGYCHGGYKADVGYSLVLNMYKSKSLAFRVSDKDQEFELTFQEIKNSKVVTISFNTATLVNNIKTNSVVLKNEELTLCETEAEPLTNLFKIDILGPRFEVDIYTSNGYSYNKICSQINVLYTLRPTHVTITRTGSKATEDLLFYPLTETIKLVYGSLGEACFDSHDCKIASSICDVRGECDCANGFIAYEGHCVPQTRTLGSSCFTKTQCRIAHSTCTGMGVCSCVKGYVQRNPTSCVSEDRHF